MTRIATTSWTGSEAQGYGLIDRVLEKRGEAPGTAAGKGVITRRYRIAKLVTQQLT